MARDLLKEEEVGSVGELRQALEGMADDTPICDIFDAHLVLSFYRDRGTEETIIEVA